MAKTDFESVEDLRAAIRELRKFVDDVAFGRLFESYSHMSNLFFSDNDRPREIALMLFPDLQEGCGELPDDIDERVLEYVIDTRRAFLTIGIFIGARIADPSGNMLSNLSEGWIRTMLAMPRYGHLAPKGYLNLGSCRVGPRELAESSLVFDDYDMRALHYLEKVGGDKSRLTRAEQKLLQHVNAKIRRYNGAMRKMRVKSKLSKQTRANPKLKRKEREAAAG